ncbi:MAG: hypothetical protein VKK04_15060 [Synechococcales bacterium]|nr:hypothetical protein [Synechococcales bacterium]
MGKVPKKPQWQTALSAGRSPFTIHHGLSSTLQPGPMEHRVTWQRLGIDAEEEG